MRAMHELEMIKKFKKDKEAADAAKKAEQDRKSKLKKSKLNEELAKRRVEMGQLKNIGGKKQELKALILDSEAPSKFRQAFKKEIALIDMNEEEDRDKEAVQGFMRKYHKVWKYLHSRYMNQMYTTKNRDGNFDSIK